MDSFPYIENYKILKKLPSGGWSDVYLAKYKGKEVALKILLKKFSDNQQKVNSFFHEADTIKLFNHPNIVKIVHVGNKKNAPFYFSMEYYSEGNLYSYLKEKKILNTSEIKFLTIEICHALVEIHKKGYIHLDLKPSNILFGKNNKIVLSDFGISQKLSAITDEENISGTPQYMSPEQFDGKVSFTSDLYSLGILMYYCATGQLPFDSTDVNQIGLLHNKVAPLPVHELNPTINKKLEKIILKLLEKKTDNRFASAKEVINELESIDEINQKGKLKVLIKHYDEKSKLVKKKEFAKFPVTISKFKDSSTNFKFLDPFASKEHATIINPSRSQLLFTDHRNLSIEMRQIFYLIKQHILMFDRPFLVYLSTPLYQVF